MSSKLVKKLLQQTTAPLTNNEFDDGGVRLQKRQKGHVQKSNSNSIAKESKEELVQEHIQSILRLDSTVQRYSSSAAKKSFDRHSADIKQRQKQRKSIKARAVGISNSRGSSSSFVQKPHERRFDKEKEKRRREEGYFEDLARALKKAKKSGKKGHKN